MATLLETLVVKLAGDAADYDKTISDAQGSLDGFAKKAQNVGGALSLAVTTPLVALGGVAVAAASDLNETISKVSTLFGDQATAIQTWADTSAESFGLSKEAALDSVGTLGNMFMQLGSAAPQAAALSQGMVELSADIASFHNVAGGSEEVLGAMTSAFRGEYDALQRYIPTINAAAVEHAALAMTGKTTADELTNLDKALAVQEMIMKGAGAAVGDFARTSDGLANTQRILQADLANISAELGQELLPVAVEVAHAIKGLLDWFKEISPEGRKWIVVIGGIAAAAGPVIGIIGTLAGGISTLIGLVGGAAGITAILGTLGTALTVLTGPVGIIIAAVAALALAWNTDFLGIKTKTQEFWNWLSAETPKQLSGLKTHWETFSSWWKSDNETKIESVKNGWNEWLGWLDTQTGGSLSTVQGYWESYTLGVTTTLAGGVQIMQGDWEGGLETLRGVAEGAWSAIYGIFGTQIDAVKRVITEVDWWSVGDAIMQGIANGINDGLDWITDAARGAAQAALDAAKSLLGIRSPAKVPAKEIGKPFAEGIGVGAEDAMSSATNRIQSALQGLMGDISMQPATAGATGGSTVNLYVTLQGKATYEDGQAFGMGALDELRARGLA